MSWLKIKVNKKLSMYFMLPIFSLIIGIVLLLYSVSPLNGVVSKNILISFSLGPLSIVGFYQFRKMKLKVGKTTTYSYIY